MRRTGTKITCHDAARHFGEHLDEVLDKKTYERIRRHLDQCPDCEAYLDSLKKVVRLYRSYPDSRVNNRIRKKLHAVISLIH